MKRHEQVGGLIWFLLGIGLCIGSIPLKFGTPHKPGPGFLPFLSGILLGLFGAILIFSTFLNESRNKEELKAEKDWFAGKKMFFFTLFALFGYALLLKPLGFLLTTFLFFFFLFKLRDPHKWFRPLVVSGIVVILSYLLFSVWLQCQLPKGIIQF